MTPSWSRSQSRRNSWRCFSFCFRLPFMDGSRSRCWISQVRSLRRSSPKLCGCNVDQTVASLVVPQTKENVAVVCQALHEGASSCILWSSHWHSEWCSIHEHTVEPSFPRRCFVGSGKTVNFAVTLGKEFCPISSFRRCHFLRSWLADVFSKVSGDA